MNKKITSQNERRNFLRQMGAGSLAAIAFPAFAGESRVSVGLPAHFLSDETYWEQVKKQFSVPENLTMLNAANLCPAPVSVNAEVLNVTNGLGRDVSFQYRSQFADKRKKSIEALAQFVGAGNEEIGITRNTSESNNIIVNGLDLKAGDEIILWDQNHPSNGAAWEQRARRYGFMVKKIALPADPKTTAELVKPFADAITPKTKLIGFSHISNTSGLALPAKLICKMAAAKGILTLVDGAQSLGVYDLDLKDLGCDFYTGSTHKWLMGPLENGILYVKKGSSGQLWPNLISAGWKESGLTVDEKYCMLGQRNEATLAGLPETIAFHQTIGKKNIEARTIELNSYLKAQIKAKLPAVKFITPVSSAFSAGVTVIAIPDKKPADVSQKLYETYGIAVAPTGGIRMSPHIYNTLSDIDKVVKALVAVLV